MSLQLRYLIICFILLLIFVILWIQDPIPQDQAYHNFADSRTIFGIPNFWDVISNLPMAVIGVIGLKFSINTFHLRPDFVTRWLPIILSLGITSACFGSMYYHWAPENYTLVWDRLPMTFMFMPLLALLVYDFMGKTIGTYSFYLLLPLGVFSVFYWHFTEIAGEGDLRLYAFVQFGPMILAPIMIWLFYKQTDYIKWVWYILGWYTLAKLAEYFDHGLYDLTGFWSGHTIKHLLGSVSLIYVVKLIKAWNKSLEVT